MQNYTLVHLTDAILLRDLAALVVQDRVTTAALLAHIAEVDARRLYIPAGYPSMHAYCVDELRLSEDAAYKRIRAARAARQFPALFTAVAEGRVHLAAVSLLAPHLTPMNVEELIGAATHRGKAEIEELLARRFGSPEVSAMVRAVPTIPPPLPEQLASGQAADEPTSRDSMLDELAPGRVEGTQVQAQSHYSERYLVQLTIAKSTRDKLRHAQALLSHAVPTGDVAQVLDRALDALIAQLEKRKFGAVTGPARPQRTTASKRHIPAQVRRAVWERDQGRCTFVSASGTTASHAAFLNSTMWTQLREGDRGRWIGCACDAALITNTKPSARSGPSS